ncbi:MAG: kelch repeat-containing protein [Dehalococcoidia bacterium]|nr:kelch repeat-containing protein [Dehalococcoidia bacterium]
MSPSLDKVRHFALMVAILTVPLVLSCNGDDAIQVSSLSEGRWGHTATLLKDGRLLVVGGKEKPYGSLGTTEIFDPSTNKWSSAGSTLEPRGEGHTATLIGNGVLITGGTDSALAEIYDLSTDQWSLAGTMLDARLWASATLLEDGRVLVAGGEDATVTGSKELASAEIYDPSTGEWTATNSMNEAHSGHSATLLNGRPLLVGRYSAEIYDPYTETWSSAGQPVRERRVGSTATVLNDERVLVTGGEWLNGGFLQGDKGGGLYSAGAMGTGHGSEGKNPRIHLPIIEPLHEVEIYDPLTGEWSETTGMSEGRIHHSAILLDDGRVLVVGSRTLEARDPDTGAWSSVGKLSQEHGEFYTATLLKDGRILIVGGQSKTDESFQGLSSVEIYDMSAEP